MRKRQGEISHEGSLLTEYCGLRIGKVRERAESDAGMTYDGLYWHYVDKIVFALARWAAQPCIPL